ncbi:MAG: flagellar hook-basal body complex protein, partial [Clostridia bacterium]|nr:flagellar hook-basal body complex protein [Clostridia bacterium]
MMRSLFAGVSGLKNHQTQMDVIGNNIANVNTIGFKKSRVVFQDMLSQTLRSAASSSTNRGGSNPVQVGLGMSLASIDVIHTTGSFQPTGKNTDISIEGEGFFMVGEGE